jgi:hypothetical protein
MNKQNFTISRYEGSLEWQSAITPADRQWILYVDVHGAPWLYQRTEDVADAATGDTLERYILSARPDDAPMPARFAVP